MLSSVLADLALCPGVAPLTLVEPDLIDALPHAEHHTWLHRQSASACKRDAESSERSVRPPRSAPKTPRCACTLGKPCNDDQNNHDPAEPLFRRLARTADFTLVIAPEFDGILECRCRWALDEGSRLLGPSPDAVQLTADKLSLAAHLIRHGVPTPATASSCPWQ